MPSSPVVSLFQDEVAASDVIVPIIEPVADVVVPVVDGVESHVEESTNGVSSEAVAETNGTNGTTNGVSSIEAVAEDVEAVVDGKRKSEVVSGGDGDVPDSTEVVKKAKIDEEVVADEAAPVEASA